MIRLAEREEKGLSGFLRPSEGAFVENVNVPFMIFKLSFWLNLTVCNKKEFWLGEWLCEWLTPPLGGGVVTPLRL